MLEDLFNSKTTARLIEYLIIHDDIEFNQKQVCDAWDLNSRSMKKPLSIVREYDLIRESRRIAHSVLYRTNKENPLYKILKRLIMEMSVKKFEVHINNG